jgi:hypothetical protein
MLKYLFVLSAFFIVSCKKDAKDFSVSEVVIYKLKEGVEVESHLDLAQKCHQFIEKFDGFVSRNLAQSEDSFVDVVFWRDAESAKSAQEKATQVAECLEYFSQIDEEETNAYQGNVVLKG